MVDDPAGMLEDGTGIAAGPHAASGRLAQEKGHRPFLSKIKISTVKSSFKPLASASRRLPNQTCVRVDMQIAAWC